MEVIAKIFNFVVLFGVLGYLCRNLLKNMFAGRRQAIGDELKSAEIGPGDQHMPGPQPRHRQALLARPLRTKPFP